jgi:hypothetical protein
MPGFKSKEDEGRASDYRGPTRARKGEKVLWNVRKRGGGLGSFIRQTSICLRELARRVARQAEAIGDRRLGRRGAIAPGPGAGSGPAPCLCSSCGSVGRVRSVYGEADLGRMRGPFLDERDRTRPAVPQPQRSPSPPLPGEDGAQEDARQPRKEIAIARQRKAQRPGEGEHPLAVARLGKKTIHEICRDVGRAPPHAARAEAPLGRPGGARPGAC